MSSTNHEIRTKQATAWQTAWRTRQRARGLCIECTERAWKAGRCPRHYQAHQDRKRRAA